MWHLLSSIPVIVVSVGALFRNYYYDCCCWHPVN